MKQRIANFETERDGNNEQKNPCETFTGSMGKKAGMEFLSVY